MPGYDRRVVTQQPSIETECTDALLKRHQPAVLDTHNNSVDDDIFSGRRLTATGSAYTSHSINAKPTPLTLEESLSGDYQQFGVQHPSVSYNDSGTLGVNSRDDEPRQNYSMHSYEEGDYPPEEQYYQDHYFHEGQCYTDDGEPYYGEDQHHDQRHNSYDDGYSYEEHMHRESYHENPQYYGEEPYPDDKQYYDEESHNAYSQDYQGDPPMYARQNEDGTWEESSEAYGTVTSKTLNTNLDGLNFLQEPYNNNYHGEEETAFDYSISQYQGRSAPPQVPYDGASTLASPVHDDDDRSHGSNSVWEGQDLRNISLMDSPLSQNEYTVDHTEHTEYSEGTRRPVSKFFKKVNTNVGKMSNVRYQDGEFHIQQSSRSPRDGSRGTRKGNKNKDKKGESATILDIMFNVGHDLIVGTSDRGRKDNGHRRKQDPAEKIVDGFVSFLEKWPGLLFSLLQSHTIFPNLYLTERSL
jgi:hypothetical protein